MITDEGWNEFFKMIKQDVTAIAGGANWYVGLCEQAPDAADVLTSITTEPTVTNGYARQALVRSAVGFPTITTINGKPAIRSATITFTASGGDFSRSFNRMFLTDAASGTSGKLYAFSGALVAAVTLTDGNAKTYQFEMLANR